jgi:hypothetical protein
MIIDNEKVFQTEDLDEVQEIYDEQINNFNEHINTYLSNKDEIDIYKEFMIELWGQDNWLDTYYAIYGNEVEQFKKDYIVELKEFYNI